MASRTRLSLRLCMFKGRALKLHSREGEPGNEVTVQLECSDYTMARHFHVISGWGFCIIFPQPAVYSIAWPFTTAAIDEDLSRACAIVSCAHECVRT